MNTQKWLQVIIKTTTFGSELVSLILSDAGSQGVSIRDANDIREFLSGDKTWDYVDDALVSALPAEVLVSGFFEDGFDCRSLDSALDALRRNATEDVGSLELTHEYIDAADWENEWRKYYKPLTFGRIAVVPAWQDYEKPQAIDAVVRLDPGRAFGTGGHESTAGCLTFLSRESLDGKRVIDYGCGSGILGLAALSAGAKSCLFIDYDENAVASAKSNAAENGLTHLGEFITAASMPPNRRCSLLLANLTADLLIRFCDSFFGALDDGGVLITGGVIAGREQEFKNAYVHQFTIAEELHTGEWFSYRLTKKRI